MASYATVNEVEAGFRSLDDSEKKVCSQLLEEAGIIIDAYNAKASEEVKVLCSCRMVRRAIGEGSSSAAFPIGSTQGSVSALGYSQSWTNANGSSGELYLSKIEKKLLGVGNKIGVYNPLEVSTND